MATYDNVRVAMANDAAPEESQDREAKTDISIMTCNCSKVIIRLTNYGLLSRLITARWYLDLVN